LIEFYKRKTLKNKKDKKISNLFKGLNLMQPHILERVIDLFARR
jgi:hypothetical protein